MKSFFGIKIFTRSQCTLVIEIQINYIFRTNQLWKLRPVIDGEFWSGAETVTVEPQQNKAYELTYHPLVMTVDGKKHTVSEIIWLVEKFGLRFGA